MATTRPMTESQRRAQQLRDFSARVGVPVLDRLQTFGVYLCEHPALTQGVYYVGRGLWPILAAIFVWDREYVRLFWHQQGMGLLILVIGITLLVAAYRGQRSPEVVCLALGSALSLILLETSLVLGQDISPWYLVDIIVQVSLLWLWGALLLHSEVRDQRSEVRHQRSEVRGQRLISDL